MRTKARRLLASFTAAATAFMIAVIALPHIEVSAASIQLPAVIKSSYSKNFYRRGSEGEIVDGISDLSKVASIKLNVVASKNAEAGMMLSVWAGYTVEGFNDWTFVLEANKPKDITISGKLTENNPGAQVGGYFFFQPFSTGYDPDLTIKINSMEYLDADGKVLSADTTGATLRPNYAVTDKDITDWSGKKAASIDKALVTVDLGKYDVAATNPDLFAVRLTRDSGSFEKVVGVKYGKIPEGIDIGDFSNTDIILENDGVNTVEIPLEGTASKGIELAVNGTVTITDIKFVDKQGKTVFHVGHPQAGGAVSDSEIGAGAPNTYIENSGSIISALPLTSDEQAAVNSGKDVNVTLSVNTANVSDSDKDAIKNKAGDFEIGTYLDIQLFKKVGDLAKTPVTELSSKIDVAVVIPAGLLNTNDSFTREYVIIHMHNGSTEIINGKFDPSNNTFKFKTDKFSVYAIAYKDTPKTVVSDDPVNDPVYSVSVNGNANVSGAATAGSEMTVTMPIGFTARVYNGNTLIATILDSGKFTMPAGNVTVNVTDESGAGMMAYVAPNTYIFSYDSNMKLIKTSRSKKGIAGMGEMTVDLGAAYAGRTATLYSGKKSTSEKITETVLDSKGRATFTVKGAKNYTLVVED